MIGFCIFEDFLKDKSCVLTFFLDFTLQSQTYQFIDSLELFDREKRVILTLKTSLNNSQPFKSCNPVHNHFLSSNIQERNNYSEHIQEVTLVSSGLMNLSVCIIFGYLYDNVSDEFVILALFIFKLL